MKLGDPERHQEGGPVKTEAKDAWGHQGLEKQGGESPGAPAQPCRHLNFCCLASRTVRE